MAILTIPLQPVPAQSAAVVLAGQQCVIALREMGGRQYFDLSSNGVPICTGVLLVNRSPIVRAAYTGFVGDFAVVDLQGDEAPQYSGWGTRWVLAFNTGE